MARIRSVHPSLFTDEAFMGLSPCARLLWIGLWTEADDQGVFEWKPLTLKARLFPVDNVDVGALLRELIGVDLVRPYEIDERHYAAIRNFRKFQRPKSPNAVHPLPDEFRNYVGLTQQDGETSDDEPPPLPPKAEKSPQMEDGGGRMKDGEEGGKEEQSASPAAPPPAKRGRRLDIEKLPDDWRAYCQANRPDLDADKTFENFRDHFVSSGGRNAAKLDWPAAWRLWVRRERRPQQLDFGNGHRKPSDLDNRRATADAIDQVVAEAEARQRGVGH